MNPIAFILFFFVCSLSVKAQDDLSNLMDKLQPKKVKSPVTATFKSLQIINAQSNETMHKNDLRFVVLHRFGDIAGTFGGMKPNFYGLDNSTDILIGFDYGLSDRWSLGLGRTKGATGRNTSQKQLFYLNTKYRLIRQSTNNNMPISVTLFGNGILSGMDKLPDVTTDADFQKYSDRMSYDAQVIITRKFSDNFSLALLPTFVRRNYVSFMDMNNMFALGIGGRMKITHRMAVIADYFLSFRSQESKNYFLQQKNGFKFYNPLGLGLEMETGGHVFNFIFTNSTAILENQFIPSTISSWFKGGFRWGFSISRTFTLSKKTGT